MAKPEHDLRLPFVQVTVWATKNGFRGEVRS